MTRLAAAALAGLLLLGACGGDDLSDAAARRFERDSTTTTTGGGDGEDDGDRPSSGIDLEGIPVEDQDDAIIEAAIEDIESFWADAFPAVYGDDFVPVRGGFVAYGPNRELPRCGGFIRYEEIAFNAFYCPSDDVIAWDTDNLTNDLLADFGPFTLAIVMAHEYGHAVQARVPVSGPTIATEQQADCFAGAFTAFVSDGAAENLTVSLEDLDLAIAGFLTLRDALGTPANDPNAHGSAFDRVGAYQDGFVNGVERCAEYEEIYDNGGTTVIDLQFSSTTDFLNQGNAPFNPQEPGNIFDITFDALESFWTQVMPSQFDIEWSTVASEDRVVFFEDASEVPDCPGESLDPDLLDDRAFACFGDPDDPDDGFIALDLDLLAQQYRAVGDFAVTGIVSQQYAFVAQSLIGDTEPGGSVEASLQADCFSGAFAGEFALATIVQGGFELLNGEFVIMSPGDLDEAVQSFLLLGEREGADEQQGTPFERFAAFRDGFLNGLPSCARYLTEGAPDEEAPLTD